MTAPTDPLFDQLVRRRMALSKASALFGDAEAALLIAMSLERGEGGTAAVAPFHRQKAEQMMAAGDHVIALELCES